MSKETAAAVRQMKLSLERDDHVALKTVAAERGVSMTHMIVGWIREQIVPEYESQRLPSARRSART